MRRLALALLFLAASCSSPCARFYRGQPDARNLPWYEPSAQPLQIFSTNDLDRDGRTLVTKGYFVIGQSSFNAAAGALTESQVREQAARIGAQVVLVSSRYTNTESGMASVALPSYSSTYSSATATAIGSGGYATAYGSGRATTYGSQTVLVPVETQRYDFQAVYMARSKQRIGLYAKPLTDELRQKLGTNKGLVVDLVVEGSPAFLADILPGDILLSIGGQDVYSMDQYTSLIGMFEGQVVDMELLRDAVRIHKQITVLPWGSRSVTK